MNEADELPLSVTQLVRGVQTGEGVVHDPRNQAWGQPMILIPKEPNDP